MKSDKIIENLLKAVDILINEKIQKTPFNITIIGRIKSFNLDSINERYEYVVDYNGIDITAYIDNSNNALTTNPYKIDDIVYILVPNNDFSNDKFILGLKK